MMGNEIKVTLYKNVNNADVDIKDQTSLFKKIKNSIKHIENTNYSMIISKKTEGFFTLIFNKIKSIFNIKKSIESYRGEISDCFYNQLNANAYLCKVKNINDITLGEISMMNLLIELDKDNNKSELISSFVKKNVKTKADLILIDKLLNGYKNLDKINFRDFVGEKFHVEEIINLFNIITLDVNNNINNNIFLFILNSCLREKGNGCIVRLVDDILKSIKYNKYSSETSKSLFNKEVMNKVVKIINIEKFVSELKGNLGIENELIEQIIDDAFQKYSNADNYFKTQEAWINTLYNKKENSEIVCNIICNINRNRILITQKIEEIVNSLDDDEMIIGMPKEQYIIRMEQILDIFSAMQAR
ncbi:hypothetical protein [Proteus terrae]|uniref:hypothetical protein n=1 Tax=Proteus terrae TaxID=1574161 RepID=UPI0034D47DA4